MGGISSEVDSCCIKNRKRDSIAMGRLDGDDSNQSASGCGSTARIMSVSSSSFRNAAFMHQPNIARYLAARNDVVINSASLSLASPFDCIANTP